MQKQYYSALLFPLASLQGPFGIGTMGAETINFITTLREKGFSYWQILPIGHLDASNSPYKSLSSFAGNPLYIDPRFLASDGLLPNYLIERFVYHKGQDRIDYAFAKKNSQFFLKMAYGNITPLLKNSIDRFFAEQKEWLLDYAIFMTAKEVYQKVWWQWPNEDLKRGKKEAKEEFKAKYQEKVNYYIFEQWVFDRQWRTIKNKANKEGLGIIGDLPFYVDDDSCDVWANQELFCLDRDGRATHIAGVPPDYFAKDGQLWGNPIYKWENHRKDNFSWWLKRIERTLFLFDKVRLDHFRAFANYWVVKSDALTAKEGTWEDGPQMDLLASIFKAYNKNRFIAEDLGVKDEKLTELLAKSSISNMNVLQFSLDNFSETMLPHTFAYNSVVYTGTHDNNTVLGWIWERNAEDRNFILEYLNFSAKEDWGQGGFSSPICQSMIHLAWNTSCKLAVTCLQDICGFGEDTRINIPGSASGNWTYRLSPSAWHKIDWQPITRLNKIFRRNTAYEEQ